MISVKNVSKYYGDKCAVDDISFEASEGEIIGLLGPNGAGKTTTMRIITAYFPASKGTVEIDGDDVFEESIKVRKKLGYLPENVPLYQDMTVAEFLTFVASVKGISQKKADEKIDEVMEKCGLLSEADTTIGTLSRGYKQRVGIAQAIINDPKVLVLDEPTVGLDPGQVAEIRDLIKEVGKSSVIILSSHILEEVSKICSKVIIMNKGQVLAVDTPENLSAEMESSERIRIEFSGKPQELENILSSADGISSHTITPMPEGSSLGICHISVGQDPKIKSQLLKKIALSEIEIFEFHREKLSLEEIFTRIIREGGLKK